MNWLNYPTRISMHLLLVAAFLMAALWSHWLLASPPATTKRQMKRTVLGQPQKTVLGALVKPEDVINGVPIQTTGKVRKVVTPAPAVSALAFTANGQTLVVGRDYPVKGRGLVELWNVRRHSLQATLGAPVIQPHQVVDMVWAVAVAPDNNTLATGQLGKLCLWNLRTGHQLAEIDLEPHRGESHDNAPVMAFTKHGQLLFTANSYSDVATYNPTTHRISLTGFSLPDRSTTVFASDGDTVCLSEWIQQQHQLRWRVALYSLASKRRLHTLTLAQEATQWPIFSPDGKLLAVPGRAALQIWDVASARLLHTLPRNEWAGDALAFSPDNQLIASDENTGNICLWDVRSGSKRRLIHTGKSEAKLAFSPDSRILAGGFEDSTVILWHIH